ncbi:hypothetical protein [Halorussus salinus]|uniref:hypothetical protein n=1 Tax=Halorussus salinus TaxID=1364935 RepID=UPI0010931E4B|nr:hypothetical protein [Halorussus salinus]
MVSTPRLGATALLGGGALVGTLSLTTPLFGDGLGDAGLTLLGLLVLASLGVPLLFWNDGESGDDVDSDENDEDSDEDDEEDNDDENSDADSDDEDRDSDDEDDDDDVDSDGNEAGDDD